MRKLLCALVLALAGTVARSQTPTKPAVLPAWGATATPTTDIVQPSNSFISLGWPLSSTPPSRQYFNWVLNYATNGVRYLTKRGIADWDSAETYGMGDLVIASNGAVYRSVANSNLANNPASTTLGIYWDTPRVPDAAGGAFDSSGKIATTSWIFQNYIRIGGAFSQLGGQISPSQVPLAAVNQYQSQLSISYSQVTGVPATQSPLPNTIALRDPGGYLNVVYLNQSSPANENSFVSQVMVNSGPDGYLRKAGFGYFQSQIQLGNVGGAIGPSQIGQSAVTQFAPQLFTYNPLVSKSANGYTEIPGGIIEEWGVVTVGNATNNAIDINISYPITFPNAVFMVVPVTQRNVASNGQSSSGSNHASNLTRTGATITCDSSGNGVSVCRWFAIGF